MPAISLKYLKDKEWDARYWDGAFITLDVVTLATGYGALAQASRLYKVWLLFEMSNATGNLLITGKVIEDDNFKTLIALQDVLVAGIGIKNLMQQAGKLDFKTAIQKLKSQTLEIKESLWEQARQHLTLWEQIKASPQVFKKIPKKVKAQIESLSEILKKEHRRLRNYELKPIKGALFSGIGLELKKILNDEAFNKLQELNLGNAFEKALYRDLTKSKERAVFKAAINENPEFLIGWRVLYPAEAFRRFPDDLEVIYSYLQKNPDNLNKIINEFKNADSPRTRRSLLMQWEYSLCPPLRYPIGQLVEVPLNEVWRWEVKYSDKSIKKIRLFKKIIEEKGYNAIPGVDKDDILAIEYRGKTLLVDGHHRLAAGKAAGLETLPMRFLDFQGFKFHASEMKISPLVQNLYRVARRRLNQPDELPPDLMPKY